MKIKTGLSTRYLKFTSAGLLMAAMTGSRAQACATDVHAPARSPKQSAAAWRAYFKSHSKVGARTPAEDSGQLPTASHDPWGGADPAKWRPEAVLANAVSEALNDGWAMTGAREVLVAFPLKMYKGSVRPYGDGQTNSSFTFGQTWTAKQPPLVATLVRTVDGNTHLKFRFHRSLIFGQDGIRLEYMRDGQTLQKVLNGLKKTGQGDYEVEWLPTGSETPQWGDLFQNHVAFVQGLGWTDWFPIDFRDVVRTKEQLLAVVSEARRNLGPGTLLDPEKISVQGQTGTDTPFDKMGSPAFASELQSTKYFPIGIHNTYSLQGVGDVITAVGNGTTVVIPHKAGAPSPFKLAYICFNERNHQAEGLSGAPSGGGWHEIGDPAETVLNTLERAPVVFGYANGIPMSFAPGGSAQNPKWSYGLSDVAVIRKLQPGQALITAAGPTTWSEYTPNDSAGDWHLRATHGDAGRNYHWFIFDQSHEVCAVEWVHNSVPTPANQADPTAE